jgi:hypothetical protein
MDHEIGGQVRPKSRPRFTRYCAVFALLAGALILLPDSSWTRVSAAPASPIPVSGSGEWSPPSAMDRQQAIVLQSNPARGTYVLADLGGLCPVDHSVGLTRSVFDNSLTFGGAGGPPALRCFATREEAIADMPNVPPPPTGVPRESQAFYRDSLQYPRSGGAQIDSNAGSARRWSVYWVWSELVVRSEDPNNAAGWLLRLPDSPADAAIAVDAHLVAGIGNGSLTLACRWDGSHGYLFEFDPASGEAMLFRWDGPESGVTALLGGPTVVTAGLENWPATIELACIGTSISASINGRAAIDAVDAIYASGEFAFGLSPFSGNSSIVAGKFHNLVLRQLCVLVVGPPQQERRCLD